MTTLSDLHRAAGATVAADGIPQLYTTLADEYQAAHARTVLLDRSHEGRVRLTGADSLALIQRTSTNDVLKLTADGQGCATVFISSIGRILDRVEVWQEGADSLLLLAAPGRGEALRGYIQKNIFFRDKVKPQDVTSETAQFALHGANADSIAESLISGAAALPLFHSLSATVGGVPVRIGRAKSLTGGHFRLICTHADAAALWSAVLAAGQAQGLQAGGSQLYNLLRIESGTPGVGRELSADYIPLEVGLWDEVSFAKGCYTGQEIIARMESRGKLAKTLVKLNLSAPSDSPIELTADGKRVGTLTSSVTTPDGAHYGIGFVKPDAVEGAPTFHIGDTPITAQVRA